MPKVKKKLTAAQKKIRKSARAERRKKYQWIFINGKQVRIKREESLEEFEKREALIRSADPIWLLQNELWENLWALEQREGERDTRLFDGEDPKETLF